MRIQSTKPILWFLAVAFFAAGAGAAPPPLLEPEDAALDEPVFTPAATPRARKEQMLERFQRVRPAATAKAASKTVDCTKGDSLQKAIDASADGDTLEVRGLCNENVKIQRRRLTLHGLDPSTDGIRGVTTAPPALAALEIWYSDTIRIENLSISHPDAAGLGLWHSGAEAVNCRMTDNGSHGVHVSGGGFLNGVELTLSDNAIRGLSVQRGSLAFCLGCRLENNAFRAAVAGTGGLLSLLDSVVTGGRGLLATNGSYADIDCITETSPYPCSLNVTDNAGTAVSNSTVAMFGAGPFAGQLIGSDRGEIYLYGAQQTSTGVGPLGNPRANFCDYFGTLIAEPSFETGLESKLKGSTFISSFARALLIGGTAIDGTLTCDTAGDAWKDAGVTGTVSGCEHAP